MKEQRSKQEAKAFAQRMLFDKNWKPDRTFMLDMIARYRPEDAPPEFIDQGQVLEWIKHVKDLKARICNDTDAQLAWSAYLFGLFIGKQRVIQHYATELKRGKASSVGAVSRRSTDTPVQTDESSRRSRPGRSMKSAGKMHRKSGILPVAKRWPENLSDWISPVSKA